MSIQAHPSQSIIKTIGYPFSNHPPNIYSAKLSHLGAESRENYAHLGEEDGLGGCRGKFVVIPTRLLNRGSGITGPRTLPASPSV